MTVVDWHGFTGWQMAHEQVRVVIVPALGAKIASLVDVRAGYEWLASPTHPVRPRAYGATFTEHELAGWDEMFPTINLCAAPHDPTAQLPDHGEVWALPWEVTEQTPDMLTLRVTGRQLAYTLTRTARLRPAGLRLEYTLENHTGQTLPFLWAAHPLFNGSSQTEIVLPAAIQQVMNVADHPHMGAPDTLLNWPLATLPTGSTRALNRVGEAARQDYRKVYVLPEQPIAAAELHQHDAGCGLRLTWDEQTAPYLGIWVDEGTYTQTTTLALEPATGYYDSLALALAHGRVTALAAGARQQWWVEVALIALNGSA